MKTMKSFSVMLTLSFSLAACQFDPDGTADLNKLLGNVANSQSGAGPNPSPTPSATPSVTPSGSPSSGPNDPSRECAVDILQQPEEQIHRSVDLLFVADTSGSMQDNRVAVADGLHAFVGQLPANVDYRIGMILAHSSASAQSGKLWTLPYQDRNPATGYPFVLDSSQMSQALIQARLREMMQVAPEAGGQGEMGMFSLLRSIGSQLEHNRAKGFFRPNAALAIVFISDENDICAVYPQNPATQTGLTVAEQQIRTMDCPNGIPVNSVIESVRQLQGQRPFLFGGVVNDDITLSYPAHDGYGWGYMELLQQSLGLSVNIESGNYVSGLAQIGGLVTRSLDLILSHHLNLSPVDPATITVNVDGVLKPHTYVESTNTVHFDDAGGARSRLEVGYCKAIPVCTDVECGPGVGI